MLPAKTRFLWIMLTHSRDSGKGRTVPNEGVGEANDRGFRKCSCSFFVMGFKKEVRGTFIVPCTSSVTLTTEMKPAKKRNRCYDVKNGEVNAIRWGGGGWIWWGLWIRWGGGDYITLSKSESRNIKSLIYSLFYDIYVSCSTLVRKK